MYSPPPHQNQGVYHLLVILIIYAISFNAYSQKAHLIQKIVTVERPSESPLLNPYETYDIQIDAKDNFIANELRAKLDLFKINGKQYVAKGPSDLIVHLQVAEFKLTDQRFTKKKNNDITYNLILSFQLPTTFSLINSNTGKSLLDTILFRGKSKMLSGLDPTSVIQQVNRLEEAIQEIKRETANQITSTIKDLLAYYGTQNETVPISLGRVGSSKKGDFSSFDRVLPDASEALDMLVNSKSLDQAHQKLIAPMSFWREQLNVLDWNEKHHRGAITVSNYNLAHCHFHLGEYETSAQYLSKVEASSGNGVMYFYSIYAPALKKQLLEKDPSLSSILDDQKKDGWINKLAELNDQPTNGETATGNSYPKSNSQEEKTIPINFDFAKWQILIDNDPRNKPQLDLPDNYVNLASEVELVKQVTSDEQIDINQYRIAAALLNQAGQYGGALRHLTYLVEHPSVKRNSILFSRVMLEIARTEISFGKTQLVLTHLEMIEKALSQSENETLLTIGVLEEYGRYYHQTGNYYEAIDYYKRAINQVKNESKLITARLWDRIGVSYYELEEFEKAMTQFAKAHKIKSSLLDGMDGRIADSYSYLANTYNKLAQLGKDPESKRLSYADQALNIRLKNIENKHSSLFATQFAALDFNPSSFTDKDLKIDVTAPIFGQQSQYLEDPVLVKKLELIERLLAKHQRVLSSTHPTTAHYQKMVMEIHLQFFIAISDKWRKAGRGVFGKTERVASLFKEEGKSKLDIELRVENFDQNDQYLQKVVNAFHQSINTLSSSLGTQHPHVARQYGEFAALYQRVLPIYYDFIVHFNDRVKVAEGRLEDLKESNPDSESYVALKSRHQRLVDRLYYYYQKVADFEKARIECYNKAYHAIINESTALKSISLLLKEMESNEIQSLVSSPEVFRLLLANKASYEIPYIESVMPPIPWTANGAIQPWMTAEDDLLSIGNERRDDLIFIHFQLDKLRNQDSSLGRMKEYDRYVDLMVGGLIHEDDKYALAGKTRRDRLQVIQSMVGEWRRVRSTEILNEPFYLTEKTKALVLTQSLRKSGIKYNQHLPEKELQEKETLEQGIQRAKREVARGKEHFLDSLATYKSSLAELEQMFKKEYSSYTTPINEINFTIEDVKENLDEKTALISYTYTGDHFFRITITKNKQPLYQLINAPEDFSKKILSMQRAIVYRSDEVYTESAQELGKILVPKLNKDITQLIIVPDGALLTTPFEVLLTKKVAKSEVGQYAAYPFLINDYSISYALSVATWLEKSKKRKPSYKKEFLGMAPIFSDNVQPLTEVKSTLTRFDEADTTNTRGMLSSGQYVQPLPGTKVEVESIAQLFKTANLTSEIYLDDEAKESRLKTVSPLEFKYLHLATHGMVNVTYPELSGLLLSQKDTDDGILYSGEAYSLNLQADLISLSACETGLGKVVSGEGIIGLSRGFLSAGSNNLLISFWKVSDNSTSELMTSFYANILKGNVTGYQTPLRTAKLNLIQSDEYAHPYYWSPFVLIGN